MLYLSKNNELNIHKEREQSGGNFFKWPRPVLFLPRSLGARRAWRAL